jgi:hypothetical protein
MSGSLLFKLEAELAGVGGGWTDITEDALLGVTCRYGIMGSGPEDRVAEPGELSWRMDNSVRNSGGVVGYYSPFHASCRSGWGIGIRVRFSLTTGAQWVQADFVQADLVQGGPYQVVWLGWLDLIDPIPGQFGRREVLCTAVDWMDWAARWTVTGVATQVNATADDVIQALVDAMPVQPESESLDAGSDTYPYALDRAGGDSALAELQRVAMSEFGLIYVRAGVLYFENRTSRLTASPLGTFTDQEIAADDEENFAGLVVESGRETVKNRIRVAVVPRTADGSAVVLFTLNNKPSIAPGESITFDARYSDPNQLAADVGGFDMVTPVATTDYTANTAENGSGTNRTASLSVSVTFGGSSARVTLTNTHGSDTIYVTFLRLRGKGLYAYEETVVEVQDAASIAAYGELELGFEMPYQSGLSVAAAIADYILSVWKDPNHGQAVLTFVAGTGNLLTGVTTLDIGSVIAVRETVTGVDAAYWVNGKEITLGPNNIATVTLYLGRAETGSYWTLDVSELGVDTMLAPA